ncbi:MAG: hypothetical protein GF353_18350 [Candidatus Lokiarchaeota archaeon]|nr:hypothetical protein [Candidatus Lokiarchaeota archaeon]
MMDLDYLKKNNAIVYSSTPNTLINNEIDISKIHKSLEEELEFKLNLISDNDELPKQFPTSSKLNEYINKKEIYPVFHIVFIKIQNKVNIFIEIYTAEEKNSLKKPITLDLKVFEYSRISKEIAKYIRQNMDLAIKFNKSFYFKSVLFLFITKILYDLMHTDELNKQKLPKPPLLP